MPAALAHCDYHIGRVIDAVKQLGELDNTLVIFIEGDNGASGEGTLQGTVERNGVVQRRPGRLRRCALAAWTIWAGR